MTNPRIPPAKPPVSLEKVETPPPTLQSVKSDLIPISELNATQLLEKGCESLARTLDRFKRSAQLSLTSSDPRVRKITETALYKIQISYFNCLLKFLDLKPGPELSKTEQKLNLLELSILEIEGDQKIRTGYVDDLRKIRIDPQIKFKHRKLKIHAKAALSALITELNNKSSNPFKFTSITPKSMQVAKSIFRNVDTMPIPKTELIASLSHGVTL